ncbi:MAG TPA: hypothetical protein PKD92_10455, partial [Novosphingobium sp.]|nr:hypothetical protein [Novosphingobium sp.]
MIFNFPNVFSVIMGVASYAREVLRATPTIGIYLEAYEKFALADSAAWLGGAAARLAKGLDWAVGNDPLVIDLDGDGIEFISASSSGVYFDFDNDLFAELSGWVGRDDGFLVRDLNGNGRIDNITEMFGNQFEGGYQALGVHDLVANGGNGDGRITAADLIWADLRVWRDLDQDGFTDEGELFTLDALGIVSISLTAQQLDITTPQGTRLLAAGEVELASGAVRTMFEAIFESFEAYTRFAGESGRAPWQDGPVIESRGYGSVVDLSVAAANDIHLGELVAERAAAMTEPDWKALRALAGDVIGYWGSTLETTRELMP